MCLHINFYIHVQSNNIQKSPKGTTQITQMLYKYILFIHSLVDGCLDYSFQAVWVVLFWTCMYKSMCRQTYFSFSSTDGQIKCDMSIQGFPGGLSSKESAYNVGDSGLIPGQGKSPGGGNSNPLQYSCLGNSLDRGAWRATVRGVTKSRTWLSTADSHTHTYTHTCPSNRTFNNSIKTMKHCYMLQYG